MNREKFAYRCTKNVQNADRTKAFLDPFAEVDKNAFYLRYNKKGGANGSKDKAGYNKTCKR